MSEQNAEFEAALIRAALEEALEEANDLLRSAHAIAVRESDRSDRTNWEAFLGRLNVVLGHHHRLMYPEQYPQSGSSPATDSLSPDDRYGDERAN